MSIFGLRGGILVCCTGWERIRGKGAVASLGVDAAAAGHLRLTVDMMVRRAKLGSTLVKVPVGAADLRQDTYGCNGKVYKFSTAEKKSVTWQR